MTALVQLRHDLSPDEIDAIEESLYDHNQRTTGRDDGQGLGFVIEDEAGRTIAVAAGYSWASCENRACTRRNSICGSCGSS